MGTHVRLGPSADMLAALIRALDTGDGATLQANRDSLLRALRELKRFRDLYPTGDVLRVVTLAVQYLRRAHKGGEVFFTPYGQLRGEGLEIVEEWLKKWGIDA